MKRCKICGAILPTGASCCPGCGAQCTQKTSFSGHHVFQDSLDHISGNPYEEEGYDPMDIQRNKGMALMSYLGILVLIPLFCSRNSPYVRFHANQGLLLFLMRVILRFFIVLLNKLSNIAFLFWGFGMAAKALHLASLILVFLAIWGIINVCSGQAKRLPLIGKIRLIH